MAYIQPRKNKDGAVTSYTIKVHRGRDPLTGRQLKPYITTWKPPANMTQKQVEKELNRQAMQFEEQCTTGAVASQKIRMADFCPQYLDIMKASLSPTTLDLYKDVINKAIIPMLGHLKLTDIKTAHVQEYVQKLSAMKISPATVQRRLVALKSILSLAVKLGYIAESPAKSEKLILPKIVTPKIEIFTKQKAAEMLTCLEKEDLQFQVMVQLAIYTGARRGELVGLKFSDVDHENMKITIERAAIKLKGSETQLKPPKDYEVRTVAVNLNCLQMIKALEAEKKKQAERLLDLWHEGGWIFTQYDGTIMNPMTPTKQFAKFLKRNGLKHRKFHCLRHSSATLLLYGGANVKQVQSRLGHGKMETTNKYLHYIEEADVEAVNILDNMLNKDAKVKILKKAE
jgi:integrase